MTAELVNLGFKLFRVRGVGGGDGKKPEKCAKYSGAEIEDSLAKVFTPCATSKKKLESRREQKFRHNAGSICHHNEQQIIHLLLKILKFHNKLQKTKLDSQAAAG